MSKVFVLDAHKRPLNPVHPGRARLLLTQGKAAVFRHYPFTIVLKEEVHKPDSAPLRLKIDPGSKTTGLAIVNEMHYTTSVQHPDLVAGATGGTGATVTNPNGHIDVTNYTIGVQALMYDLSSLRVCGVFPLGSKADADEAVAAARQAFPGWRRTSRILRAELFDRLAQIVKRETDNLAENPALAGTLTELKRKLQQTIQRASR